MSATLLDLRAFEATKYMSADGGSRSGVALTVSLFDHLLNFGDELELVWSQPRSWSILQSIVMVNRYGGELSMIFIAYILAGFRPPISTSRCHGFVVVSCFYFGLSEYGITGSAMSYSAPLNICVINPAAYHGLIVEYTQGVWGGMLLYDVYVFAILIANAMNRPRRHNAEIITNLNRDGAFIFLPYAWLSYFLVSLEIVAWALDNTLSSRLFLKMKAIEIRKRPGWSPMEDLPSVYVMQTIELDDS
ncbi:hypothetical protein IEO21_03695 [Rhodonia placenta]|uniref:DUF6533 domain-containing protein n=1 Tax=Rhodonia placenta TaxID=104341 RepID=A0A8H7U391_9APHY|nr:hypothetical protein IEO21_03695 [Postia placenta]